jgi:NitT/TauT family transport system substrate-binding protein
MPGAATSEEGPLMRKRLVLLLGVVAVASVCVTAAAAHTSAPTTSAKQKAFTQITVQAIPIASIAPLWIGLRHHFFQKQGLAVHISINFQGGAANLAPVLAGKVQIGFSDVVPTMLALKSGVDLVSIAACAASGRTDKTSYLAWTVKNDSGITKPADFVGKTIATNTLNNVVHVTTVATLDKYGVKPGSYKFSVLPLPALVGAVSEGKVDAAQMVEPSLTLAKAAGQRPVLFPFVDALPNGGAISTYYALGSWARANPGTVRKFQKAMNQSTIYATKHAAEIRQALPLYANVDAATAAKIILPSFDPKNLGPQAVQTLAQLMLKYGFWDSIPSNIKQVYPPPVK